METSTSNFQLIVEAFDDYTKVTGTDLSRNPFAEKLQFTNSPDAVLELLLEREHAFQQYRDGNRRLRTYLSPAVKVLHGFSATLGEAVPFPPAKAVFVGISVLLAVRPLKLFSTRFILTTMGNMGMPGCQRSQFKL